jgi:SPP1 gp7 family putative phage head morphogenesis protein
VDREALAAMSKLPFNVRFRQAADWFAQKAKLVLPRSEFDQLADEVKVRAFTVATVTKAEILQDTLEAVQAAISDGLTMQEFGDLLGQVMEARGWGGLTPWHMETIFRSNVQSAYGAGRWEQQRAQRDEFPYLHYQATHDARVRATHLALDGTVAPIGDPFWKRYYPPWAYNCRCYAESITEEEAQAIGIKPVNILEAPREDDFTSPAAGSWTPDLSGLDPVLRLKVEKALAEFRPSSRED